MEINKMSTYKEIMNNLEKLKIVKISSYLPEYLESINKN